MVGKIISDKSIIVFPCLRNLLVLTRTKIIVSKKKWGADLTTYFKDPQLVVGQTPDGYDIEIILGTVDAN